MSERAAETDLTPCGVGFEHNAHLTRTQRGKVLACDGYPRSRKVSTPTGQAST